MKKFLKLAFLFCCILFMSPSLKGQTEPELGQFSFINCVALPGNASLKINGVALNPDGFKTGNYIQGGQYTVGAVSFLFEHNGAKPITQLIQIDKISSIIVIGYSETITKDNGETEQQLKLVVVPSVTKSGTTSYSGIYISGNPSAKIEINGKITTLEKLKILKLKNGGGLKVTSVSATSDTVKGKSINFTPDRSGSYLLIVFDSAEGSPDFRLLQNSF